MYDKTTNLEIKFMSQSQSKKESLFNDALMKLDAINSCLQNDPTIGDNNPPAHSQFGLYAISPNATGNWKGQGGNLAYYLEGWKFIKPWEGMILFYKSIDQTKRGIYVYYDNKWNKG